MGQHIRLYCCSGRVLMQQNESGTSLTDFGGWVCMCGLGQGKVGSLIRVWQDTRGCWERSFVVGATGVLLVLCFVIHGVSL